MRAPRKMPRIGIITGSGPDAGIDLWTKTLAAVRRRGDEFSGDTNVPEFTIFSLPTLGLSMELESHRDQVLSCLLDGARDIAARTDLFCIACNTLHVFAREILDLRLKARFVSVTDTTCKYVRKRGLQKVALLSTSTTAKNHIFESLSEWCEIEVPEKPQFLDNLILNFKRDPERRAEWARQGRKVIRGLSSAHVILACTELPLFLPSSVDGKELIDASTILAEEIAAIFASSLPSKNPN